MRTAILIAPLAIASLTPACRVDLEPSGAVQLTCGSDADCPEPLICHPERDLCVSSGEQPPFIESVTVTVPARPAEPRKVVKVGDAVEIEVRVNEPLADDPSVRIVWLGAERAAARTAVSGDGLVFTHALIVEEADPEGFANVVITVVDTAGLETTAELTAEFEVDMTPPAVEAATSAVAYLVGRDNPLDTVTQATDGTGVRITINASESLGSAPTLRLLPPTAAALTATTLVSHVDTVYVFELSPATWPEDGTYATEVTLVDLAGNATAPPLSPASLTVEVNAGGVPPTPSVGDPDLISYTRVPWGADANASGTASPPSFTLSGGPGAATPGTTLLVLDGPEESTATEVARTRVRSDGSFGADADDPDPSGPLRLPMRDRDAVWLVELDAAGNGSLPARVRDGSWVATLVGRRPGLSTPNPNVLWREDAAPATAFSRARREPSPIQLTDVMQVDGNGVDAIASRAWSLRQPQTPYGTFSGGMVYQAGSGDIFAYGAGQDLSDTNHLWNGDEWRVVQVPGLTPGPRFGAAMTYDSRRDRVVLYGGTLGLGTARGDTWEWTGSGWLERTPYEDPSTAEPENPPARFEARMTYDSSNGRALLFGGFTLPDPTDGCPAGSTVAGAACYFIDTWAWDGDAWSPLCIDDCGPPGRMGHSLTFDPSRGEAVLFGGCELDPTYACQAGGLRGDTWIFDGALWSAATPSLTPPAVFAHGAAYVDRAAGSVAQPESRVVIYGGCASGEFVECRDGEADLWGWDGAVGSWQRLWQYDGSPTVAETNPAGRAAALLAYDRLRGELVMLGGSLVVPAGTCDAEYADVNNVDGASDQCIYRDTWTWSLADGWRLAARPGNVPDGRRGAGVAYLQDASGVTPAATIFFSGNSELGRCDGVTIDACPDLWSWDGRSWQQRCGSQSAAPCSSGAYGTQRPAPRNAATMVGLGDRAFLAGGFSAGSCGEDVGDACLDAWTWDPAASSWTHFDVAAGAGPDGRGYAAAAYDELNDTVVLFGGDRGSAPCPAHSLADSAGRCQACDVWQWSVGGSAWARVWPTTGVACEQANGLTGPLPRSGGAMAYMPTGSAASPTGSVLLYGGCADSTSGGPCNLGSLNDLWRWDGSSWTLLGDGSSWPSSGDPGRRTEHQLVYDSRRARLILDGGRIADAVPQTWEWSGLAWTPMPVAGIGPFVSDNNATAFDAERQRLVVYVAGNTTQLWELNLDPYLVPALTYEIAVGAANASGSGPDRTDLLQLRLVADVAAEGSTDGEKPAPGQPEPAPPAVPDPNPARQRGARLQGWDVPAQSWRPLADNCADDPAAAPAVRRLSATVADPASLVTGQPGRIYARLVPCRGSGSSAAGSMPWVALDYIEATVTYRLP